MDEYKLRIKIGSVGFYDAKSSGRFLGTLNCMKTSNIPRTLTIDGDKGKSYENSFMRMLQVALGLCNIPIPYEYCPDKGSDAGLIFHPEAIPEPFELSVMKYAILNGDKVDSEKAKDALYKMRSHVLAEASGVWSDRFISGDKGSLKPITKLTFTNYLRKLASSYSEDFDYADEMKTKCKWGLKNSELPNELYTLDWKDFIVRLERERFEPIMEILKV